MSSTTERVLRLLWLLQQRPVWTGPELAERLGVTTRSVRRDVGRLRELGYPVHGAHGSGGGYQLGRGRALPPLLLDDEEAVAVAVSLRLAAGGTVTGASEAAVRTLAKLDQVMPPRLRSEVHAIQGATVTLEGGVAEVAGEVLLRVAQACRDRLRLRFGYAAHDGAVSRRHVEPVSLVATGRRWYLMAWDLDRDAWRTFRVDRTSDVVATTWRFAPREHPDPAAFVQRAVSASPYRWQGEVRYDAPADRVREWFPPGVAGVEAVDDRTSLVRSGADHLEGLVLEFVRVPFDVLAVEPPELREAMGRLAARLNPVVGP